MVIFIFFIFFVTLGLETYKNNETLLPAVDVITRVTKRASPRLLKSMRSYCLG